MQSYFAVEIWRIIYISRMTICENKESSIIWYLHVITCMHGLKVVACMHGLQIICLCFVTHTTSLIVVLMLMAIWFMNHTHQYSNKFHFTWLNGFLYVFSFENINRWISLCALQILKYACVKAKCIDKISKISSKSKYKQEIAKI